MTSVIDLEGVIKVGDNHVAALVQRDLVRHHHNSVSVWFAKRPVAILVKDNSGIRAIDPQDGTAASLEDVERLSPGVTEAFIRATT